MNFLKLLSKGILWFLGSLPQRKEDDKKEEIIKTIPREIKTQKKKTEVISDTKLGSKQESIVKKTKKINSPKLDLKKEEKTNQKRSKNKSMKNEIIEIKPKNKVKDNDLTILEVKTPGNQSLKSEKIPNKTEPLKFDNNTIKDKTNLPEIVIDDGFSINIASAKKQRDEDVETRSILDEIFKEEEEQSPPEKEFINSETNIKTLPYQSHFHKLIKIIKNESNGSDSISRKVIEDFAEENNLMPDVLIDSINDYSLEKFNELLLEEEEGDDSVYVEIELLTQICKSNEYLND